MSICNDANDTLTRSTMYVHNRETQLKSSSAGVCFNIKLVINTGLEISSDYYYCNAVKWWSSVLDCFKILSGTIIWSMEANVSVKFTALNEKQIYLPQKWNLGFWMSWLVWFPLSESFQDNQVAGAESVNMQTLDRIQKHSLTLKRLP